MFGSVPRALLIAAPIRKPTMGYDFALVRLDPRPDRFPFSPPPDFGGKLMPFQNPASLEQCLLESAAFRLNAMPVDGLRRLRWETPDGGSLDVVVSVDWIDIDTHAHWRFVRHVYDLLRPLQPDLVLADKQTSTFHDADAFQAFIVESDRRKSSPSPGAGSCG